MAGGYYENILTQWLREAKRDHARLAAQIERMGNRDPVKRAQIVRLMNFKAVMIHMTEDAIGASDTRYPQRGLK